MTRREISPVQPHSRQPWFRLACAGLVEIAYAIGTRLWLPTYYSGIPLELLKTACRCAALTVFLLLFKKIIFSKSAHIAQALHPIAVAGLIVFMSVPFLVGADHHPDHATQIVFALTSIFVGIKEEFLYRGALQNLMHDPLGLPGALVASNIIFAFYHYGARPLAPPDFIALFAAGCILGLIYSTTGSLWLAILVHAAYDALFPFSPFLSPPLPSPVAVAIVLAALGLFSVWAAIVRNEIVETPFK